MSTPTPSGPWAIPEDCKWKPIADAFDALELAVAEPCPECEGVGEHESDCRENPDREPSDDDMESQRDGVWNGVEAERRSLRDAGRDKGGGW